jgi:serine protease Do
MARSRAGLSPWVLVVLVACAVWAYTGGCTAYAVTEAQNRAAREQLREMSGQDTLSGLFAQVAEVLRPAVVEVRVTKKVKVEQQVPDIQDFLRKFFGEQGGPPSQPQPREYLERGLGSGVVVDAGKGYILTNYHVVAKADETQVTLADGRTVKVDWARSDPLTDLAVLKVTADNLIEAPLGDSGKMRVGYWVLAIGAPEGLEQTVTAGIISAKGRTTDEPNTYQDFLQTDAAINPGNSGGPLVNMAGEVIGLNTAIITQTGMNAGIGLAIPSNMIKAVMLQLIEKGKVTRGFLGVTIQSINEQLAKSFSLPTTKGALVAQVTPDSPAAKAGLKAGDFIVGIAGKSVTNPNDLRNTVANLAPGQTVPIEFYRDGKKQTAQITVEAQPASMFAGTGAAPTPQEQEAVSRFGMKVSDVTADLAHQYGYKGEPKGVLITQVTPGSAADEAGLKAGMLIKQVQDQDVTTAEQFGAAVSSKQAAHGVRLLVTDAGGAERFVFLSPGQ